MVVHVSLPSGQTLRVPVSVGSPVVDLRTEVGKQLEADPDSVELVANDCLLEDGDVVSKESLSAVIRRLSWLDDGSGQIEDLGGGGLRIGGEVRNVNNKFNAICDLGFSSGTAFFEVHVLQGDNAFVGVTTWDGFGPGYKFRGLMFGGDGNLSNGAAALRYGFGGRVAEGSVVGVVVDLKDPCTVGVTFWQDARCLGEAFAGCHRRLGADVYPVVSSKGPGDHFRISLRRRMLSTGDDSFAHPAVGIWQLRRLQMSTETTDVKTVVRPGSVTPMPTLEVSQTSFRTPNAFTLSIQVCNTLTAHASVTKVGNSERISLCPSLQTTLLAASQLNDLEKQIADALPSVTGWSLTGAGRDGPTMLLKGGNTQFEFVSAKPASQQPISSVRLP